MKDRQIIIFILIMICCLTINDTNAQTEVHNTYDASGNRITCWIGDISCKQ